MARITVEDCLDRIPNRFSLVMLVAKRAKQLLRGSDPVVQFANNKYVVTALREVANGNVFFDHDHTLGSQEEQISRELVR